MILLLFHYDKDSHQSERALPRHNML